MKPSKKWNLYLLVLSPLLFSGNLFLPSLWAKESKTSKPTQAFAAKLDINQATLTDLIKIPGIGKSKAQNIIKYRTKSPFKTLDELENIPGIGKKLMIHIKPYFMVKGQTGK